MIVRNFLLLAFLFASTSAEDVCPQDYVMVKRIGTTDYDAPPLEIVRQAGSFVQFKASNAWSNSSGETLEHLYASYHADPSGKRECLLEESLPPLETSETMTAYCTPNNMTMVRMYIRDTNFVPSKDTATIPECCNDPDPLTEYPAIEYIVAVNCQPTCEDPQVYEEPPKISGGYANDVVYGTLLNGPFNGAQHGWAWKSPGGQCTMADKDNVEPCGIDTQLLDRVLKFESSYLNFEVQFDNGMQSVLKISDGASEGGLAADMRTLFPAKSDGSACASPATKPGLNHYPIRLVRSGQHFHHWLVDDFQCDTAARMEIKVTPDCIELYTVSKSGADNMKWNVDDGSDVSSTNGYAGISYCVVCDESTLGQQLTGCQIEAVPIATDCCQLGTEFTDGTGMCGTGWSYSDCPAPLVSSNSDGLTVAAYQTPIASDYLPDTIDIPRIFHQAWKGLNMFLCLNEAEWGSFAGQWPSTGDVLTGTCLANGQLTARGPLARSATHDSTWCGFQTGLLAYKIPIEQTDHLSDWHNGCLVDMEYAPPATFSIRGDGHSYNIETPPGIQSVTVDIDNAGSSWKKAKLNFNVVNPSVITGIAAFLRDSSGNLLGNHVQLSKNWHTFSWKMLYDGRWITPVTHLRVPPGMTTVELALVYQYFGPLHGVSHSQLSLIGWGTFGLWEEVGLGSNGEAITFEPHGHHRRQTVLDTRGFLTCGKSNVDGCDGTPDTTGWTDNVGGADFLNAVDLIGQYQYLVEDQIIHTMNGPRLTNASYSGVTVDRNIHVERQVSTWSADDMAHHLHSFRYDFPVDVPGDQYARFALYTLGGDNYNYVKMPHFAFGSGRESITAIEDIATVYPRSSDFEYDQTYYHVDAPAGCGLHLSPLSSCWFAMLSPEWDLSNPDSPIRHRVHRGLIVRNFRARLGGQSWPPTGQEESLSPFSFSLIRGRPADAINLELGLPSAFLNDPAAHFQAGDFIEMDVELVLPPRLSGDYYGISQRLRNWLDTADVQSDSTNGWKVIAMEANKGDDIVIQHLNKGLLEREYPPRIRVDGNDEALFKLAIPYDMPGVLPITLSGVGATSLLVGNAPVQRLWRFNGVSWQEFGEGGDYQLNRDITDETYTFVYSLRLEFDTVRPCEEFYFGEAPPASGDLSCF